MPNAYVETILLGVSCYMFAACAVITWTSVCDTHDYQFPISGCSANVYFVLLCNVQYACLIHIASADDCAIHYQMSVPNCLIVCKE